MSLKSAMVAVPYEQIAGLDLSDPAVWSSVELFLGRAITQSLAEGNFPPGCPPNPALGLHETYAVQARLLSWECWFEHVVNRRPSESELVELCGPIVNELIRQANLLTAVMLRMENRKQHPQASE